MERRKNLWNWLAASAVMLVLCGSAACLLTVNPHPARRLPDGSTVRLERVAFGRTHKTFYGPNSLRPIWNLIGRHHDLGAPVVTSTAPSEVLALELSSSTGAGAALGRRAVALDEHGCVFCGWVEDTSTSTAANRRARVTFDAFPRRQPRFTSGLLVEDQPVLFEVANPRSGQYPVWTAEPYPIRKTFGQREFILTHIERAELPAQLRPRAHFEVRDGGVRSRQWIPVRIESSDPNGNRAGITEIAPESGWPFQGLCNREPAWKLTVTFAALDPRRVAPDLEWTVRNLRVAADGTLRPTYAAYTRNEIQIELAGSGQKEGSSWQASVPPSGRRARVAVNLPGDPHGLQVSLIRITNSQGRDLTPPRKPGRIPNSEESWSQHGGSAAVHDFDLPYLRGENAVDLTFRVHRTPQLEFLARP